MIIMDVRCNVCGKELVDIVKEVVTQEDIDMYKATVSCAEHGQQDIIVVEEVEPE